MIKIKFKLRRLLHTMALVTMTPAGAGAAYLGVQYAQGNFHVVEQGQLYRSGQLNAEQIQDYTKRYGIRTIVNLRGRNDEADWYRTELTVSEMLGLTHIDFGMSATRETSIEKVDELEKILRDAPKPILIHCHAGSDRSGLAAAVFMHRIRGMEIEKAEGQVSLYYGHIGIPYISQAYPVDETWEKLEDIYRARHSEARL